MDFKLSNCHEPNGSNWRNDSTRSVRQQESRISEFQLEREAGGERKREAPLTSWDHRCPWMTVGKVSKCDREPRGCKFDPWSYMPCTSSGASDDCHLGHTVTNSVLWDTGTSCESPIHHIEGERVESCYAKT